MPSDEVERRVKKGSSATADTFITVLEAGMMDDAMTEMAMTSMIIRGDGIGATATTSISSTVRMVNSIGLQWTNNMRRAQTAEESMKATPIDRSITDITINTHIGHINLTIMMMFSVVSGHSMTVRMARERRGSRTEPSSLAC